MRPRIHPAGCLSVVVPCFDEEATVATTLARVLESPLVGEVVVVDDGSRDRSVERVRDVADPRVRLFRQPRNLGKGAALRRGFALASRPIAVVQDADAEYDPAELGALVAPILEDRADVVFGSRFPSERSAGGSDRWHRLGNRILTVASNLASGLELTDMETGYKAFRREVLESLDIEEDRFGFEPEITAKVAAGGWRLHEIAISYRGRSRSEGKKIRWLDGLRAMYCIARYNSRLLPAPARPPAPADFESAEQTLMAVLDNLEGAANYTRWIVELVAPHLGSSILEVGAGYGTFSRELARHGKLVACDPSVRCVERLRQRLVGSDIEIVLGEATSGVLGERTFDSLVLINVLEHIEKDVEVLRALAHRLTRDGRCITFVPALPRLYSEVDRALGHYRRYRRGELIAKFYRAGLEVVDARYVNLAGAPVWWLGAKLLGISPDHRFGVGLFDRIAVPITRALEALGPPPLGQSLLVVGRRVREAG